MRGEPNQSFTRFSDMRDLYVVRNSLHGEHHYFTDRRAKNRFLAAVEREEAKYWWQRILGHHTTETPQQFVQRRGLPTGTWHKKESED